VVIDLRIHAFSEFYCVFERFGQNCALSHSGSGAVRRKKRGGFPYIALTRKNVGKNPILSAFFPVFT
jgi:hypothetical protein